MTLVNVLLDLPLMDPTPIYTYYLTENQREKAGFGWRVLVEMGSKKLPGWILDHADNTGEGMQIKPVLRLMGDQPLFDAATWQLAQWVASSYLCPLSITLKAMLPPGSGRGKPEVVVPASRRTEGLEDFPPVTAGFLRSLAQQGQMEWEEALNILGAEQLQQMRARGLIKILGGRRTPRDDYHDQVYACADGTVMDQISRLAQKAPRQAEALECLSRQDSLDCRAMERKFGRRVVDSLLEKGYIKRQPAVIAAEKPEFNLSQDQTDCLQELEKAVRQGGFGEYLLFGITGSGKTEIYLRLAGLVIARGQKVMVLVPEIALTRHLTRLFSLRIPGLAVLHSSMTPGERSRTWQRIGRGEVNLVLGTRLAVFAPLTDLGLIIIDEEQENTFKQEESPRYHAREVAAFRARREEALLVMGSATPSMETYYRVARGEVKLLRLQKRVGSAALPEVMVDDLRKNDADSRRRVIGPLLKEQIKQQIDQGRQSILFINRRGYSPYTLCRSCGNVVRCPNCSVALSYHSTGQNICHYCDYHSRPPAVCPACGSRALQMQGAGTQRVEEEIRRLFPEARVERLDLDSSRRAGRQQEILDKMKDGQIDILVGTQMVAKGLDFPEVSLVGIVDADSMLNIPDFRAGERSFQLMVQAAGRAGRGAVAGRVVIQTYNPDNYVIQRAASQDFEGFFREEIKWRRLLQYPPFTHLLRIVISGENHDEAGLLAGEIGDAIDEALDALEDPPVILGPAPCPLARLRGRFRFQILAKSPNLVLLSSIGRYIINKERTADGRVEVDIDPLVTM